MEIRKFLILRIIYLSILAISIPFSAQAGADDDFNIDVDSKNNTVTIDNSANWNAAKELADEEMGRTVHHEFNYKDPDLQKAKEMRDQELGIPSRDNVVNQTNQILGIEENTCSLSVIKKQYLDKSSTSYCWYCNIISTMTNAYLSAVAECTGVVQTLALLILRYGFLIWLAYYILQQVSSLAPTSLGKMLQEILMMGFKVLLATIAVRQGVPLLTEYFLDPVMLMGIDYGQEMLDGITTADVGSYTSEASRANGAGGAASIGGGGGGFSGGGIGGSVR